MTITNALLFATVGGTALLGFTLDVLVLAMWLLLRWRASR